MNKDPDHGNACEATSDTDAAFIVRAVNSHEALVEALTELHDAILDGLCNGGTPAYDGPERLDKAMTAADSLLASIKERGE